MRARVNNKYLTLKAALIRSGTNLKRWAEENNYPVGTVYKAARGERGGVESVRIRRQLEQEVAHAG